MKFVLLTVLLTLLAAGSGFAQSDYAEFQRILNTKCTQCHTRERIEAAMRRGDNFDLILNKMLRFGAKISPHEQQVLGVFWSSGRTAPISSAGTVEEGKTVSSDPLGEYRAILERRCTGCHSLDRVEKAMQEGRSVDDLVDMMRKRGAVITEQEKSVLGTFWGQPFKKQAPQ